MLRKIILAMFIILLVYPLLGSWSMLALGHFFTCGIQLHCKKNVGSHLLSEVS